MCNNLDTGHMVPSMQTVKLGRRRATRLKDTKGTRQEMWEGTCHYGSDVGRMGPLLEERTFTKQAS